MFSKGKMLENHSEFSEDIYSRGKIFFKFRIDLVDLKVIPRSAKQAKIPLSSLEISLC